MFKVILVALVATTFFSSTVFAESEFSLQVTPQTIKSLESVLVTGTITDVSDHITGQTQL